MTDQSKPRKIIPSDYYKIGSGEYMCAGFRIVRVGKSWKIVDHTEEYRTLSAAVQWCRAQ